MLSLLQYLIVDSQFLLIFLFLLVYLSIFSFSGAAGMIVQELVNGKEIFVNLGLAEDRFDAASQAMLPVQF